MEFIWKQALHSQPPKDWSSTSESEKHKRQNGLLWERRVSTELLVYGFMNDKTMP